MYFLLVIKVLFSIGLLAKQFSQRKTFYYRCPTCTNAQNWVTRYKRGKTNANVKDEHLSGKPISATPPENVDSDDMILKDRRIRFMRVSDYNFYKRLFHIVQLDFVCENFRWNGIKAGLINNIVRNLTAFWRRFRFSRIITTVEMWTHHYGPETRSYANIFVLHMTKNWLFMFFLWFFLEQG